MGEEYGETQPFLFFTDFHGELAEAVRNGRAKEFAGHSGYAGKQVPDPNAQQTFENSKLNWQQANSENGRAWLAFTRQLLQLRQQHIAPLLAQAGGNTGKVVTTAAGLVAVSWTLPQGQLSLAFNIGKKAQPLPDQPGKTIFAWPQEQEQAHQHKYENEHEHGHGHGHKQQHKHQQRQPQQQQTQPDPRLKQQPEPHHDAQAILAPNSLVVRLQQGAKK